MFEIIKNKYKGFSFGKMFFELNRKKISELPSKRATLHEINSGKKQFIVKRIVNLYEKLLSKFPYILINNRLMKYVLYRSYRMLRKRIFHILESQGKKCNLKSLTPLIIDKTLEFLDENEITISSIIFKVVTEVIKWVSLIITAIGTLLYNAEVIFLWVAKF